MRKIRLFISDVLRRIQLWIAPNYWRCYNCGAIEWKEQEVRCWNCTMGEMIYKGD